jgi:hypothetical protein
MNLFWIKDMIGFKILCISVSESIRVNSYSHFCKIANFFPDTLVLHGNYSENPQKIFTMDRFLKNGSKKYFLIFYFENSP